jgi:hypothetical protein
MIMLVRSIMKLLVLVVAAERALAVFDGCCAHASSYNKQQQPRLASIAESSNKESKRSKERHVLQLIIM